MSLSRMDAWLLLSRYVKNKNLRKHCLACEAALEELAPHFDADPARWGLVGLLHDLDVELTQENPERHALLAAEMLADEGLANEELRAIKGHCGQVAREATLDHALYAVDPTTGLIVAAALMHPSKSLTGVDLAFLLKRFKEKRFAAGANREQIAACAKLGLELDDFLSRVLASMQHIAADLQL